MKKIQRTPAPAWLKDYEEWGEWSREDRIGFRNKLLGELARMTRHHCSFCDENLPGKQYVIEHFRPKIKFPSRAFEWENLFLCCPKCNIAKGIKFDESLLRPDQEGYEFDKYFKIDFSTGELLPNPEAGEENQECAKITIDTFKLNSYDRPRARLKELRRYRDIDKYDESEIDDYSFRFFLKRGENADLPKASSVVNISPTIDRIRVEYITIRNVKCFEDVTINFNAEGNTTLILGNNSRGKSLILQLSGLGMNEVRSVPFPQNWKKVVKTGRKTGTFEIGLKMVLNPDDPFSSVDDSPMHFKLKFEIDEDGTITCIESDEDWAEWKDQLVLIGYGVSRSVKLEEPPPYKDIECKGYSLNNFFTENEMNKIYLNFLIEMYDFFKDKENFFNPFFDKLAGTDKLRLQIIAGKSEKDIRESWQQKIDEYKKIRTKYLLYPDF